MRRILLLACVTLIMVGNIYPAEVYWRSRIKGDTGVGALNGRFWRQLNDKEKSIYIMGFDEGQFMYSIELEGMQYDKISKEERAKLAKSVENRLVHHKTNAEIIQYIDKIYSNDLNLTIPILWARRLLLFYNQGIDTTDIILMLRKESELIHE